MSPPMIYAGHHPRPGARQLTDGSGSPFFIILVVVAIVGFFWWMTRKRLRKEQDRETSNLVNPVVTMSFWMDRHRFDIG